MPQLNGTRMELARLRKKLLTAVKGHKLMKDKRDGLMRCLLALQDEVKEQRSEVKTGLLKARRSFLRAKIFAEPEVETALSYRREEKRLLERLLQEDTDSWDFFSMVKDLGLAQSSKNILGVEIPVFVLPQKPLEERRPFFPLLLDEALQSIEVIFPKLVQTAETEEACRVLEAEIEKTGRRVNALEYAVIPETQRAIRYIRMKLDENERGAQVRLMKIKEKMAQEARQQRKRAQGLDEKSKVSYNA